MNSINRRRFQLLVSESFLTGACWPLATASAQAELPTFRNAKVLPVDGVVFDIGGREAFLIAPAKAAEGKPWVWYAPTLKPLPGPEERWMIRKFLDAGVAIAGVDVGESFGSKAGRAGFSAFYEEMTVRRGMSRKPAFLCRSRGGLQAYNWSAENPANISCIAGIYPVCDISSWPGLAKAAPAYGMTADELQKELESNNPVSRLKPLAELKVPIFHIHGDVDTVVPLEANSGAVAAAYKKLGGEMALEVPKGQGHNMWPGFFESQSLVDFVLRHVKPAAKG